MRRFRVALSFAGEKRDFVASVASILATRFSEEAILYDRFHVAEFARADAGFYLPELYHTESDLIVVVLCAEYNVKDWCGLEWDSIFALIKQGEKAKVMLCRFDFATVRGLFNAAFVDLDDRTPEQAAALILQRLAINEGRDRNFYIVGRTPQAVPAGRDDIRSAGKFDVALSFAQQDRDTALELARLLTQRGATVFYDEWGASSLWGTNLDAHMDAILRYRARYCIVLASKHYAHSEWSKRQLTRVLAAAGEHQGDYVLPIRLDDVALEELVGGIGYVDAREIELSQIANLAVGKILGAPDDQASTPPPKDSSPIQIAASPVSIDRWVRTAVSIPRAVDAADITSSLLALWPEVPEFERAKVASEACRVLGHREQWHQRDDLVDFSYPYTAWRTRDAVFISTLPGPLFKPQKTMEFVIVNGEPPRLMLSAVWQHAGDEWKPFNADEFHRVFEGLWADRSDQSMEREATIYFARQKRYTFAPPVVPFSGKDEALCGWTTEAPPAGWFDWDRNPHLTGAGFACEETYWHLESKCAVHVFTIQGGWHNSALFTFHDMLNRVLPGRVQNFLLSQGSMRVALLLKTGRLPSNEDDPGIVMRLELAILRMLAAQQEWLLRTPGNMQSLPLVTADELRAFDAAIAAFGDKQFIHCPKDDGFYTHVKGEFVRPRMLAHPPRLTNDLWRMSRDEVIAAVTSIETQLA